MPTGAFPRLAAVFGRGRIDAGKDSFEVGLRVLLEGIRSHRIYAREATVRGYSYDSFEQPHLIGRSVGRRSSSTYSR